MRLAPPVTAVRRAARPAPAFHGPARAFSDRTPPIAEPVDAPWNHELPGTGVEVILELAGTWELDIGGTHQTVPSFAAGLVAAPVRSRGRGSTCLVQLAVDPLTIPVLFGVPAGELRGAAVDLDALLGPPLGRLLGTLEAAADDAERAATADAWTRGQLRAAAAAGARVLAPPPDVARAVALLRASGGTLRIDELATELGCSRRHLARSFATWLGVSPSEYRRLLRFERATTALRADPSRALGTLAFAAGYADHAHMDREFGALAGAPPRVIAARLGAGDHAAA